jgi:hypothetical protein
MIKASIYNFFGRIYVPDSFDFSGPYLLHISDTPSLIFGSLDSFIKKIQPEIIVHSGDLVDNLKLELYPSSIDGYRRYLKRLIRILEGGNRDVYYAIGNHDDKKSLEEFTLKGHIIETYEEIHLAEFTLGITHKYEDVENKSADYILFGHNIDQHSDFDQSPKLLNGIDHIALIHLKTGEITTFSYPHGTKDHRLLTYRKGL